MAETDATEQCSFLGLPAELRNGIYRLIVTASDIRGNSDSLAQVFIVRNGAGT